MQNSLDDKIDKLTLMVSKVTAQDNNQNKQFKPKIYQSKWRGQSRNYYDQSNYDQRNDQIDTDQIVLIEGHHSEVEFSMNRIVGEDHVMSVIIEMTLEETIL